MKIKTEQKVLDFISAAFFESVKISPEGNRILYSYKIPSEDGRRYIEKIHLCNIQNGTEDFFQRSESASMPRWSPGGLLFSIASGGKILVFKESFSECIKEFHVDGDIIDCHWGMDDDSLWVLSREYIADDPDMPIEVGNFNFPSNIFYINLKTDEIIRAVSEKTGFISGICSSPKENKVYYLLKENDIYDYASQIKEFDLNLKKSRKFEANAEFSAIKLVGLYENDKVVFLGYDAYPPNHCMARRYFSINCDTGEVELLLIPVAERGTAIEAQILSTGKDIVIKENAGFNCLLYSLKQKVLKHIITLEKSISNISISNNGKIAFVAQDFSEPPNVYFSDTESMENYSGYVKVSDINKGYCELRTQIVQWKSMDDKNVEGILVYPMHYVQNAGKYPLAVITTGRSNCFTRAYLGFSDLTGNGEKVPYPVRLLAEKGYFVLLSNSRSTGYHKFEDLKNKTADVLDGYCFNVLKGIEKITAENDSVDPERIAVMGWVLGGYISARIASMPDNNIKVLIAGNAVTDLISMFSCSNCYEFKGFMRGGFWESEDILDKYIKTSPVKYVGNIKAAVLIQHGTKEPSMPVEQGREFYYALRLAGKDVKMTEYPNLEHQFGIPQDLAFATQEVLNWLEEKL